MRLNRGRGWEDLGPTNADPTDLPEGVRLPYAYNRVGMNGHRYATIDKVQCRIDTTESFLGPHREDDKEDSSKHDGLNHIWQAHPHAHSTGPEGGIHLAHPRPVGDEVHDEDIQANSLVSVDDIFRRREWVPDPARPGKDRLIQILAVTLPHDCRNHLPDADAAPEPTLAVRPLPVIRLVAAR